MDNIGVFFVFIRRHPHLLERTETGKDTSSYPGRVLQYRQQNSIINVNHKPFVLEEHKS